MNLVALMGMRDQATSLAQSTTEAKLQFSDNIRLRVYFTFRTYRAPFYEFFADANDIGNQRKK